MAKIQSVGCIHVVAAMLIAFSGASAEAASACQKVKYAAERSKLQRLLSSNAFPRGERDFLLKGIEKRVGEVTQSRLNARGVECRIQGVRALIFGCLNETLPSTLRSAPSLDRKTGKTLWGKANVSSREAAVIGMFHACRGSAMEAFLSGQ